MSGRRSSSVEGSATGIFGMLPESGRVGNGKLGWRPADQARNGVLELRPLHAHIDGLRFGVLNLGRGQRQVRRAIRLARPGPEQQPALTLSRVTLSVSLSWTTVAIEQGNARNPPRAD